MDFVFYDLETTGLSPAFDQPLQFAAILTDEAFVEKERVNFRCRLAPHILPSPKALLVTGVSPGQLTDPSLPTLFEFSQRITALTEQWAPAIWVGYNTISFDEEVLRQTFYQNLSPHVYATLFNGNARFDVMHAVYAAYARHPDLLNWPENENGKVNFKLDQLAPANGFNAHNAHDALGDVEATLHLARLIKSRNGPFWNEISENAFKKNVQAKLETFKPLELVARFGGNPPKSFIGCFCGYGENNSAAFFDLDAADPAELMTASPEALFNAVDSSPLVIRSISVNKAPPLLEHPNPSPEHLRRAKLISETPSFHRQVKEAMAARYPEDTEAPAKPIEAQIYGSFYSNADIRLLKEFQIASWRRRQEIVASLSDPRLRQLGRRLIAFYSPELLTVEEHKQFKNYLHAKWNTSDSEAPVWMTSSKAQAELEQLRLENPEKASELDEISKFIEQRR